MRRYVVVLFVLFTLDLGADPKGEEIARRSYDSKEADNSFALATMVLISKRGHKKVRSFKLYTMETEKGTNTFIEFQKPADVRGSRFLTLGNKDGDDDQWLYLPALRKVRRISSSQKEGSFMGSDLNYYDMEDRDFNDAAYTYLKDEQFAGKDCWVIEMVPADPDAPYSKSLAWVSKEDDFMYKIVAYDKRGRLRKTIVMVEVERIEGIITPVKIAVDNHQEEHQTLLQMDNLQINQGVNASVFSIQNLER